MSQTIAATSDRRRFVRRCVTVALAAVVTGAAWLAGRIAAVDYLVVTPLGTREVGLVLTVVATVAAGLAGWAALALLERYTPSARRTWVVLAVIVLIGSIVPVFATPAALATRLALAGLHCVAAAVLIPGLAAPR
jgi:hypothetical protein